MKLTDTPIIFPAEVKVDSFGNFRAVKRPNITNIKQPKKKVAKIGNKVANAYEINDKNGKLWELSTKTSLNRSERSNSKRQRKRNKKTA